MMKFDVATIVINYKTEDRTIEFVTQELCKCSFHNLVVVVNNQATAVSTEKLADALKAAVVYDVHTPEIARSSTYIIHNEENSGFARGNNLGVEFIKHHFVCDYLLFSNNDICLQDKDTVEKLIYKLDTLPDVGIIGPKVVGLDGHCQSPSDYIPFWKMLVYVPWVRFMPLIKLKLLNQDEAKEGYYYRVMGSFFVMRYDDFMNCGMMDPITFLYYEEVILSERLCKINKRVYYYPEVSVTHEHGVSVNKAGKSIGKRDYMFESAIYFYQQYKGISSFNVMIVKFLHYTYNVLLYIKRNIYLQEK